MVDMEHSFKNNENSISNYQHIQNKIPFLCKERNESHYSQRDHEMRMKQCPIPENGLNLCNLVIPAVNRSTLTCETCGKTFADRTSLTSHILEHTQKRPYACQHCCRTFKHKGSLLLHVKIHRIRICHICAGAFSDNAALRKHARLHKTPLTCRICHKCFASKVTFEAHKRFHLGRKRFKCKFCAKTFLYKRTLTNHLMSHSKSSSHPKLIICDICGRRYCYQSELMRHKKQHDDKSVQHLQCSICGKCFALKTTLNTHLKIHGSRKSFVCALCNSTYLKKSHLEKHILRDHLREKPDIVCGKCPKMFYTHHEYRRHNSTHFKIS